MTSIPLVTVSGSHGQMGEAYGRRMAAEIGRNIAAYEKRFRDHANLSEQDVRRRGGQYRASAHNYDIAIESMLIGIAEGADLPVELVFALNARTELLYGTGHRDGGCTALSVLPSHTRSGHTLIAQNWDWHPEQMPLSLLLATRDDQGFEILTLTEAGMLAKSGLNSAGIGVCANLLVSDRDHDGDGVPYHLLLRGALHAHTMADAIRATTGSARTSSGNILLADAGGEAIDLELAPDDFTHLLPLDGLLTHANHFEGDIDLRDLRRSESALTLLRPTRVRHLLEDTLAAREVTHDDIRQTLRDHYSYPDGVCRHINPRDAAADQTCSVYSVLMDLAETTLHIAAHPICENDYQACALDDLWATDPRHAPSASGVLSDVGVAGS